MNIETKKKYVLKGIIACLIAIAICLILLVLIPEPAKAAEEVLDDTTLEIEDVVAPKYAYSVTAEERELIARLVHCEASVESQQCRIGIASVIFNRLDAGLWGDTIEEVIYYPYAFTPVLYNALYDWDVTQEDYDAVDYVIANGSIFPEYVRYFRASYDHSWENYTNYCVIDNTYFGYFVNWQQGEW